MSAASEKETPSTSADRVPTGSSDNHLLPLEARHTLQQHEKKRTLPPHRHKCIKCGCPSVCCQPVGFLLWVLFLILIQGGPIAVLYMDHHYSDKYGSTLDRFQAEEGMEAVLCTASGMYSVDINGKCKNPLVQQRCLYFRVIVYPSNNVHAIINFTHIVRSEREWVLRDPYNRACFNLDICEIDSKDSWTEYRRKMRDYVTLLEAKQKQKQSFICYYKMHRKEPLVLLEMNTSLLDFILWFVLPISCLCVCWLCIIFVCYWFCYPCDKEETGPREYHEINAIDTDRSDYSINSPAGGSGAAAGYAGNGGTDEGGWATRGPSESDTSAWPLYWR